MLFKLFISISIVSAGLIVFPSAASAAKINTNVSTVTVTEEQFQIVQVSLTQPIICPLLEEDEICQVTLPLVISDPSRATTSVASLTWLSTEWAQIRTFRIYATHDEINNSTNTITVGGPVGEDTTAPFFLDASILVNVNITDIDEAPVTTSTSPQSQVASNSESPSDSLADTGSNTMLIFLAACTVVSSGFVLLFVSKRKLT